MQIVQKVFKRNSAILPISGVEIPTGDPPLNERLR